MRRSQLKALIVVAMGTLSCIYQPVTRFTEHTHAIDVTEKGKQGVEMLPRGPL